MLEEFINSVIKHVYNSIELTDHVPSVALNESKSCKINVITSNISFCL